MHKGRIYTWLILGCSLAYTCFLVWLAFYCIWAFAAIIVITICCIAYAIKHAELVSPDDDKYDKTNTVLS